MQPMGYFGWSYERGDDGVEEDGSELVEERSGRYEVASLHDDGRQDDGEEQVRVELDDLVLVAAKVRCLLYTSPSPRDRQKSRMPSSA